MEMAVVQREHIPDGIALSENHLARLRPALRVGRERQPGGQQVVELSQHERRQEQWCAGLAEGSDGFSVLVLAAISCGQQTTFVEKDHTSPKPARDSPHPATRPRQAGRCAPRGYFFRLRLSTAEIGGYCRPEKTSPPGTGP